MIFKVKIKKGKKTDIVNVNLVVTNQDLDFEFKRIVSQIKLAPLDLYLSGEQSFENKFTNFDTAYLQINDPSINSINKIKELISWKIEDTYGYNIQVIIEHK